MNIFSFITDNIKASPAELLKPLKEKIEKGLGHTIETFSMEINTTNSEMLIRAEGKEHREVDKNLCFMIKKVLKFKLGKKAPDFTRVAVHYNKDHSIGLALYLTDGTIQTEKF